MNSSASPHTISAETPEGLIFGVENHMGVITLNRPKSLNALSIEMMHGLRSQLLAWRHDPMVHGILVQSATPGMFCAGGDLKRVYDAQIRKDYELLEYMFRQEYALTYLIATYPKPYIAITDGVLMGGGMGLAAHAHFHIMGDHIKAAMPETNIGYFPDVGATDFLQKASGRLGLYLGLTGNHISTGDALYARWGTHYVPSNFHINLAKDLIALPHKDQDSIQKLLLSFQKTPPPSNLQKHQRDIDEFFHGKNALDILQNLEASPLPFAQQTAKTLRHRSPTSLAITYHQITSGPKEDMEKVMAFEFILSQSLTPTYDFCEGIRAAVIDKDRNPQWHPKLLEDVQETEIKKFFTLLKAPLQVDA